MKNFRLLRDIDCDWETDIYLIILMNRSTTTSIVSLIIFLYLLDNRSMMKFIEIFFQGFIEIDREFSSP